MKNRLILSLAMFLLALGPISALAQVDISPGVGRVSLTQGDVSTQRGDSGEWSAAALNAPIVSGDKISTGDNARAEVQLDFANILRLGDHSQATIANLTRNQIQVQIGEGIANYDVFPGNEANAEIDTPNVAIHPRHDGASVRVIVNSQDETQVIVRRGSVDLSTPQGSTHAEQGQMYTVKGTGDDTAYKSEDAPPSDDWDAWINSRDDKIQNAKSWNDTDRYYTGSEDLDAYGQWQNSPDYGPVWVPTVGPDWAPYRAGQWVWEPYYGWTWVSTEPWGWAPYHYGRWMYYNSAWAWWPGPVVGAPYYRPVWAPAYVSFFGFGGGFGFSVGFGFGSFGWLPCGPGDFFHPWWGGYRGRFGAVNVTNIYNYHGAGGWGPLRANGFSNVRLAETNEHVRSGLSTVPAGRFGAGRMDARPVDAAMFHDGRMMTGNVPVVPSRESLSASNRAASPSTIRNSGASHFYSNARPASVESFQRQASQMQQSIERDNHFTPVRSGEQLNARNEGMSSIRPTEKDIPPVNSSGKPSAGIRAEGNENTNSRNSDSRNSNDGFNRFGSQQAQDRNPGAQNEPNNRQNQNSGSFHNNNVPRPGNNQPQGSGSDQNGWHRFSESGQSGSQGRSNVSNGQRNNVPRPPNSTSPYSNRSGESNNSYSRSTQSPSNSRGNSGGGDYRPFSSPRSGGQEPSNRGGFGGGSYDRGNYPSRTAVPGPNGNHGYSPAPGGGYRGYPSGAASARSYSRPPLDMRQPIVGGHSSGGFGGGGYHGGGGSPSFHSSGGSSHGGGGGGSRSGGGGGGHRR